MADGEAPWAKRPPISMILKLVATVVILALVFYSLDLDKLSGALSAIDWHWLILGSVASALFVSLRIIKWRELTRTNGMSASGKEIARTALLGLAVVDHPGAPWRACGGCTVPEAGSRQSDPLPRL